MLARKSDKHNPLITILTLCGNLGQLAWAAARNKKPLKTVTHHATISLRQKIKRLTPKCEPLNDMARDAARPWRPGGLCVRKPPSRADQGTVTVIVPVMPLTVREMSANPAFFAVASPFFPGALLIPTTDGWDEFHAPP